MKKVFLLVGASLAIGVTTFISCNKKDSAVTVSSGPSKAVLMSSTTFDFSQFGLAHNSYLDFLTTRKGFSPSQLEVNYNYGQGYVDPFLGQNTSNVSWTVFQPTVTYDNTLVTQMFAGVNPSVRLISDKKISADMGIFLDQLAVVFRNAADTGRGHCTPPIFNDSINVLENAIIAGGNYSIDSKTFAANDNAAKIIICEIAKSSFSYWNGVALGTGNVLWAPQGSVLAQTDGWWSSIKIAACDSWGFVADGWQGGIWYSGPAVRGARDRSAAQAN
jgi:hypothetical protein